MKLIHPAKIKGRKVVVIVGGGFAGLNAAKTLAHQKEVYVVLIDQKNHHLFQPLLYQVATAGLNAADIAVPIRAQFSKSANVEVHLGRVAEINLNQKHIKILSDDDVEWEFDYLILACGARHSYFAHPEWEEYAPGLKSLEQATEIRRRILTAFEQAENEQDPIKQKSYLNFVIVGGGPTGVELAGAIADISRTVIVNDFKRIDPKQAIVTLVEAGPRLLATFDPSLSERTQNDLAQLGVTVRLSSRVENINAEGAQIGTEFIPSKSIFWAAGVQATKVPVHPVQEFDRAGRIKVTADLSLPKYDFCFAVGDMAAVEISPGVLVPGLAPAAIQEGRHAAQNILNSLQGKPRTAFQYLDKGQMATIGKHKAIVQFKSVKIAGYIAWLAWFFVHIFYLVGFKNRVFVMSQWAWNYLFSKRGARLITEKDWMLKKQ